ncbi:hypothetical protein EV421DRAFT_1770326 [Armillaria borealis]|uniref:Uncharacterized protein n=1 Tax=Armillaria borealis TaxID=47425 RepID=A0AA39K3E1_9AGAR|nr:hypothetical protein EV421DRAFT_1770326 [Armillaria borealis]
MSCVMWVPLGSYRDLRRSNVVRASHNAICPRHERAHLWRLIDFDIVAKTFITPEAPTDSSYAMNSQARVIGTPHSVHPG